MQYSNLSCKFNTYAIEGNENLMKVKLRIIHDGYNKKTNVTLDAIKDAEESLKNIPILARVLEDGSDFNEHDVGLQKVNGEYKLVYIEKPIGVIGSDTEISYETIDDKTYLNATGYIWTKYNKDAERIINESDEKGCSMEIDLIDYVQNDEDDSITINKFEFTGVTILGDHIESAAYDTILEKYSLNSIYKKELKELYKEIYSLNNNIKEENLMEDEVKDDEIVEDDKKEETIVEKEDQPIIKQEYSLSVDDMYTMIHKKLESDKVEVVDYWGDKYLENKYWVNTILPMDKIVILSENGNYYDYFGVPFEIVGDDVELMMDKKKPYIREWREKVESQNEIIPMNFAKDDTLKEVVLDKFSKQEKEFEEKLENYSIEKNKEIEELKKEVVDLQQYKAEKESVELEQKVEEISEEFANLSEDEVYSLKKEAIEGKLSLEMFKKELVYLVGVKAMSSKEKYSVDKDTTVSAPVFDIEPDKDEVKPYGGLFENNGINY